MKKRIFVLFVSLFALTPAVLGSAWGGENRGKNGSKLECDLLEGKHLDTKAPQAVVARPVTGGSQSKIY